MAEEENKNLQSIESDEEHPEVEMDDSEIDADRLPPEFQQMTKMVQRSFYMMGHANPGPPPSFYEKLKPEHLTQFLKIMADSSKSDFSDKQKARIMAAINLAVVLLFVFFVIWLLKDHNSDLLGILIDKFSLVLGGLGLGTGVFVYKLRSRIF